ncbi:Hypothetical predicted protein [Cloeon dipterum]|nr:Hypothetical predicted protein [Cloeon dipterum]
MLSDSDGEVYFAFNQEVYINKMNTKKLPNPIIERFYEPKTHLPELLGNGFVSKKFYSFAIDSSGTFWLMFQYGNQKPMLLKAALNMKSYLNDPPKEGSRSGRNIPIPTFPTKNGTDEAEQDHRLTTRLSIIIPVFIFGVAFISWILLRKETGQVSIQRSMNENSVELGLPAEQPVYHEVQESPLYEFVPATPLFPATDFSTEYDDVGSPESEELYDDVGPGSPAAVQYEEMNYELPDLYLRILPDDVNEIHQN